MALIDCKDVSLGYENRIVCSGLNFQVQRGDCLCIVGENGSGKSTLMKAILGLKEPVSGHLHFGDGLTSRRIGYLPQQTTVQRDFPASVYEVVLSGCLAAKGRRFFFQKAQHARARETMETLDILDLKDCCYRELSGGQQQRVLLARALCATQELLLLDEPVAGLDPLVTAEFYRLIQTLNKEHGVTVVMVSHDLFDALALSTHILHMQKQTAFFGTKDAYLQSDCYRAFGGGARDV